MAQEKQQYHPEEEQRPEELVSVPVQPKPQESGEGEDQKEEEEFEVGDFFRSMKGISQHYRQKGGQ